MKKNRLQRTDKMKTNLYGYCKSKMILFSYLHLREWTDFFKKMGREPVPLTAKIHSLVLKGTFLIGLLCATGVAVMNNKYSNAQRLLLVVNLNSVWTSTKGYCFDHFMSQTPLPVITFVD